MTTPQRDQLCPQCQQLALDEVINHMGSTGSIIEAAYLCPEGHGFQIRWVPDRTDQKEAS